MGHLFAQKISTAPSVQIALTEGALQFEQRRYFRSPESLILLLVKSESHQFLETHAFVYVLPHGADQKLPGSGRDVLGKNVLYFENGEFMLEFLLCLRSPWRFSDQHFEEDDPDGPDIALVAVLVAGQGLKGHVERRPYVLIERLGTETGVNSEAEVSNADLVALKEDVHRLKIPVYYLLGRYVFIAIDNLLNEIDSLRFH